MNISRISDMIESLLDIDSRKFLKYFLPILLLALFFRFFYIELRPPHHDEGINGWFVMLMWQNGLYTYDPENYHGPIFFYLLQLSELIFGKGIFSLRFVTSLFSLVNVFLVLMHYRFFGRVSLWAALIMAISPAYVFYGRYAIHETILITSQLVFSYGFFSYFFKTDCRLGIICMTAGFFGGFLTKETFFIFFGVWAIAIVLMFFVTKYFPARILWCERTIPAARNPLQIKLIIGSAIACFSISVIFFTGFFMNLDGFYDMFSSFAKWTHTGVKESGHEKPWYFWLELMKIYEWIALFSAVAGVALFYFSTYSCRLLFMTGIGLLMAYSIIPYKTPWIIINIIWPFFFVFGYLVETLAAKSRKALAALLYSGALVFILINAYKMTEIVFRNNCDEKEKYVYTHTDISIAYMMKHLEDALKIHPEMKNMVINVYSEGTWPLPWTFSDWPRSTFCSMPNTPSVQGDFFVVDVRDVKYFEAKLKEPYIKVPGKLRGAYTEIVFYYRQKLFKDSWENIAENIYLRNKLEKVTVLVPSARPKTEDKVRRDERQRPKGRLQRLLELRHKNPTATPDDKGASQEEKNGND